MMIPLALLAAAALTGSAVTKVDETLLKGLPTIEAVLTAHGETHRCTGPTLASVLVRMGAPHGDALRGKALTRAVIARARDGYAVLFSLGEIDAGLGAEPAIIATRCDGKAIDPKDGPYRLVLPGEQHLARSVRQLESLEVVG